LSRIVLVQASFHRRVGVAFVLFTSTVACGGRSTDGIADSGAGATGGTSNTGGSGGTGGVSTGGAGGISGGGGTGGVITSDSGVCGCVTRHIGWGQDGGHVAYRESSALEICDRFIHQRVPLAPDPPGVSCEQAIMGCSGVLGPGDVTRALDDADVRAAIAAAPVLYGSDPRPVDGQVMRIEIGAAIIEVGGACSAPNCKPIPPGVTSLAEMLKAITKQQLSRAPCNMTFPPPP
jgi:hypothetical protein